jgi:hypothetical protein
MECFTKVTFKWYFGAYDKVNHTLKALTDFLWPAQSNRSSLNVHAKTFSMPRLSPFIALSMKAARLTRIHKRTYPVVCDPEGNLSNPLRI